MKIIVRIFLSLIFIALNGCGGSDTDTPPGQDDGLQRLNDPIFKSPQDLAADPNVIRTDSNTLHMYYTAENKIIGLVQSSDNGMTWEHPNGLVGEDYAVLQGRDNDWDRVLETVDVIQVGDDYWMYYTGYREGESDNGVLENYEIGLAISTDGGLSFVRHPNSVSSPLIAINRDDDTALDRHAMTSPSVVFNNGQFNMVYTGWNVTNGFTGPGAGIWTLGAISVDGINWEKMPDPILTVDDVSWANGSINESDIFLADDNTWIFTFTAEEGIGYATSSSFTGPYVSPSKPLLVSTQAWEQHEVVAPDILIEPGFLISSRALRLWYTGVENNKFIPSVIGYAEIRYPL